VTAYDGRGWQFYVFPVDGWAHVEAWRPDGSRFYAPSPFRDVFTAAETVGRRNTGAIVDVVIDPREIRAIIRDMEEGK
jgi:hypothetical protein